MLGYDICTCLGKSGTKVALEDMQHARGRKMGGRGVSTDRTNGPDRHTEVGAMDSRKILVGLVVVILVTFGSLVVMGFMSGKKGCTPEQVDYCIEEASANIDSCQDDGCIRDLLGWFENDCMSQAIHCDSDAIDKAFEKLGWKEYK